MDLNQTIWKRVREKPDFWLDARAEDYHMLDWAARISLDSKLLLSVAGVEVSVLGESEIMSSSGCQRGIEGRDMTCGGPVVG